MIRRLLLVVLATVSCAPAGSLPNVVLITVDTLRADRLGCYGYDRPTSPNIDKLAAEGILFSRALAAASSTTPSHATIFTGQHPRGHTVGPLNGYTRLEGLTMAQRFADSGYQTAGFISNILLQRRLGFHQGFEHYDDELPDAEKNRPHIFERIGSETVDRAMAWLDSRDTSRPFFLWVHVQDPHGPYTPPAEYAARFPRRETEGEEPLPVLEKNGGPNGVPAYQVLQEDTLRSEYEALYDAEIAFADHHLGRIFDDPSVRDAVVLLTADHGEGMGEYNLFYQHGTSSWPAQVHVPMILKAPGLDPAVVDETVAHIDVLPTLLELAGLPAEPSLPGLALKTQLGNPWPQRTLYCDIGIEVTAYEEDDLIHVWPADHAWRNTNMAPQWSKYHWSAPGQNKQPVDDARKRFIAQYLTTPIPMVQADAPSDADVKRLRSLGYVD